MSAAAPTRRSTRTRNVRGDGGFGSGGTDEGEAGVEQHEEDWEGQNAEDDDEPVKKKARKTTKSKDKGKGKVSKKNEGKLAPLLDLPVEIFTEVARHLDPLSLLHLSRASKAFHQLFASRSSRSIWQAARDTVDMPDLEPDDASEMVYASLLFEKNCHVCGKNRAVIVNFDVRHRFCKKCYQRNFFSIEGLYKVGSPIKAHSRLHECLLGTTDAPSKGWSGTLNIVWVNGLPDFALPQYAFTPDARVINDKLLELQGKAGFEDQDKGFLLDVIKQRQANRGNDLEEGQDEFQPEEEELKEYVLGRRLAVKAAKANCAALKKWDSATSSQRREAREALENKRYEAIIARVEEAGYDKQHLHPYAQDIYKLIWQPRLLSDAIWQRISVDILAHVEKNRNARLDKERLELESAAQDLLQSYYDSLVTAVAKDGIALPPLADFIHLPAAAQFWYDEMPAKLDDDNWKAVVPVILSEVAEAKTPDDAADAA